MRDRMQGVLSMGGVLRRCFGRNAGVTLRGAEASPASCELSSNLLRLASGISEITRRAEPDFLQLAGSLKGLYSGATELGRATSGHVNAVRKTLETSRLTGVGGLTERALSGLESGLAEAGANLSVLSGVGVELSRLQSLGSQMERVAMFLKASGCTFAVESARTAACQQAFGAFVEELRQLAGKIRNLGSAISEQSSVTCAELRRVHQSISAHLDKLRQLTRQSDAAVRQAATQMQQLLDSAWAALKEAERHANQITRHANDAVFHLQFGDILRQKLEHVVTAVGEAAGALRGGDPSVRGQAAQRLAIQAGQLELIEAEIQTTRTQLADAFTGLGTETTRVLESVRSIGSDASLHGSQQNIFENLKHDLLGLNTLQLQGRQLCVQTGESSQRAIEASAQLSRHLDQVREINREMHVQALNAIIKTALLGDEGQTLGVHSMHVHTVFQESNGLVEETVRVLHEVAEQTSGAGGATGGAGGEQGVGLQQGIDQLSQLHEGFQNAVASASSLGEQQESRLAEAHQRLEFLSGLSRQIAGMRQQINEACATLPKPAGFGRASNEDLNSRYTMESEREVHRRLSGAAVAAPLAAVAVASAADDNMEFFDAPVAPPAATVPATSAPEKIDENLGDNIELF